MTAENDYIKVELELGPPSQKLLDWAKENIGEDPDTRDLLISDFRDMIYERGECTPHRTDDAYLLKFLRARHFILPLAHRLICNYYEFKEENPHWVEDVSLKHLEKIGDDHIMYVPPYLEQNGRRLLHYKIGNWDLEKFSVDDLFAATMIILEIATLEPSSQIKGGVGFFDLGGLTMQQAMYMTPSIARKMLQLMVTSFPFKIHAIHIVNQSWIFDIIYGFFKPFLKDSMTERIFFHGEDWDSLHQHIDPKYLSVKYGGIQPEKNYNRQWFKWFRKTEAIVSELKSLGYKDEEALVETDSEEDLEKENSE